MLQGSVPGTAKSGGVVMAETIISEVAQLWVDLGGDAEGITWCWMQIRDEVQRIEREAGGNQQ
jgi:hypothetical protein